MNGGDKMVIQNMGTKTMAFLVILLLVGLGGAYMLKSPEQATSPLGTGNGTVTFVTAGGSCDESDNINSVNVVTKDSSNTSSYEQQSMKVGTVYDGDYYGTGTSTAAVTKTYSAINAYCSPRDGTIVAISTTAINGDNTSFTIPKDRIDVNINLNTPDLVLPAVVIRDDSNNNLSSPSTGDTDGTIVETTPESIGKGVTFTRQIKLWIPTPGQYGSDTGGLLFGINTVNAQKFGDKDIVLTSESGKLPIKEVSCGDFKNAESAQNLKRCYTSGPISQTDSGIVYLTLTGTPNKGDPGASDDPILNIDDINWGEDDLTGEPVLAAYTNGLVDIGGTNVKMTFNLG